MVNTRHIEKNGLSFECPDYYDIGKYPSSDGAHKSMVALSKHDRKCELYITVYRRNKFDNNAKRNTNLLKSYLQLQNYRNITINYRLPYCFNATVSHHMGNIKTTIAYDFNHGDEVIMIVGNLMPSSNYDCIGDIKIILDSLQYENSIVKRVKSKITSKNKVHGVSDNSKMVCSYCGHDLKKEDKFCSNCGEKINLVKKNSLKNELFYCNDEKQGYRLSKTKIISLCVFMVSGILAVNSFLIGTAGNIDLLFAVLIFIVVGLIFSVPTLIIGTMIKKSKQNFGKNDAQLKHVLFYCENDEGGFRLSKTKIISWCGFIISGIITAISYIYDPTTDGSLLTAAFVFVFVGTIVAGILFLMGIVLRFVLGKFR